MRQPENVESEGVPLEWRRYPYAIPGGDPELVFPDAEGDQGAESNAYYVSGRLVGTESRREWAFFTIFTFNDIHHVLRADFYTLALFDLASGDYGTHTEFDLPRPLRVRRAHRLSVARGRLDVTFDGAPSASSWRARRSSEGSLEPFAYSLSLFGQDAAGRNMHLELEADPQKPPMPVGGLEYGGKKTCIGQYGTHSYFQSNVRFRGRLVWGDTQEDVEGDAGWIDRQWAPRFLGVHNDWRNRRYRHEWRQITLDNGVQMSVWLHYDRARGNRAIPFCGVTAADSRNEVHATTEFTLERLSFVRDPDEVKPLLRLASGARYFTDRYRLLVPAWNLELVSEPIVSTPAHRLPIEYWSGPTRVVGSWDDTAVRGLGFHERTMVFARDFELVEVLRQSVRSLSAEEFEKGSRGALGVANLIWEIDGFLSHRGYEGAVRYLQSRVRPELEKLVGPGRDHILQIADDLDAALMRWWVRP